MILKGLLLTEQGISILQFKNKALLQGGEDDLDALLKNFELQDKKAKEIVVVSNTDPPTPRLFATFTPVPGPVLVHFSVCSPSFDSQISTHCNNINESCERAVR